MRFIYEIRKKWDMEGGGKIKSLCKKSPGEHFWGKEWNMRKKLRLKGSACTLVWDGRRIKEMSWSFWALLVWIMNWTLLSINHGLLFSNRLARQNSREFFITFQNVLRVLEVDPWNTIPSFAQGYNSLASCISWSMGEQLYLVLPIDNFQPDLNIPLLPHYNK